MTGADSSGPDRPHQIGGPAHDPGAGAVTTTSARPTLPRSVLLAALRRMGDTAAVAVPAIALTALVQSLLMYVDAQSGLTPAFLASFAVSATAALGLYAVLSACALAATERNPSADGPLPRVVVDQARARAGLFVGWVLVQWVSIAVVSVVNPLLVAVVALLTPYVPLAAMDGHRNALSVNLRVIAARPGRWLLTWLVLLVAGLVLFLLSVANTLLVKGMPAAAIFWLVVGAVAWWVLTAWALIYRSTRPVPVER